MTGPRFPTAPGRYIPLATRERIMSLHEHLCFYCGLSAVTIDHVIPWSQGGTHHPMNLVACCQGCNSIAGERLFRDITDKINYVLDRREQLMDFGWEPKLISMWEFS